MDLENVLGNTPKGFGIQNVQEIEVMENIRRLRSWISQNYIKYFQEIS